MDCSHDDVFEKVCQLCARKVEPPTFVSWSCTPTIFPTKKTLNQELVKSTKQVINSN